tara:strand:+ start:7933 stop:8304 length:372 start_codon:yes stop_codon:yes gene_type:complete
MVNGKLVLAIDFDGTIAELSFPQVGALRKGAAKHIRKLHDDGHYIIINTCRSGKFEGMAHDFMQDHGIPYHYMNSNLPELIVEYGQDCRKISADIYIDDKCIGGLPSWEQIYQIIQERLEEHE